MERIIGPSWGSLAWRGAASIVFGAIALAWPTITLASLTMLFGAYAIADGVLAFAVAARRGHNPHRWYFMVEGVAGILAGIVALVWPQIGLLALIVVVGVRALFIGSAEIGAAFQMRHALSSPWLLGLSGVLSVLFGIVTLVYPLLSAYTLVTVLGMYAIFFGITLLGLAYQTHRNGETYIGGVPAAV
jgi:uncharacterized membrane protein HdeD (DUF308 family)